MLKSIFTKEGFQVRGIDMGPVIVLQPPCALTPKAFPLGGGAPARTLGRMRGRSIGPTGRKKDGVGATGPSFYKEKVGYRIAPSSVTFGDSFPQGKPS